MEKYQDSKVLRVAFPYKKDIQFYEPTRIHLAPEYIFLENIYSPLVELNKKDGIPEAGLAEEFSWKEDELHLKIRDNLQTIDGIKITAEDALFSLKRLLIISDNTHGNFKDIMCPDSKLESIDAPCAGMRVENNTLILKPKGKKTFLLPMLAAIDFAVIPRTSVDPKTLKIKDYRNTSGPYYVSEDNGEGKVTLSINKNHYHYSDKIPQKIELVPAGIDGEKDAITLFKENKVDYITTIDKLNPEKVIDFSKTADSVLHTTMNIRTYILCFTSKGLKRFSEKERILIGKKVKEAFRSYFLVKSGFERTDQFFPQYGDGAIEEGEVSTILSKFDQLKGKVDVRGAKLSIIRLGKVDEYKSKFETILPGLEVVEGKNLPAFSKFKNENDMPDMFINGPDTGFMEDIGLISYSLNAGYFGDVKKDIKKWLHDYMTIEGKDKRMDQLKALHKQTLEKSILVPLASSPYVALARKGWKIELSQIFANNPLWPVIKE
jgi:hypothetical protein